MNRKRGRPTEYVHGRDGKLIFGLSRERKSQRFYATGVKPRVYFGKDFDVALMRFRAWESANAMDAVIPLRMDSKRMQLRLPLAADWSGPICEPKFHPPAKRHPLGLPVGPLNMEWVPVIKQPPEYWKTVTPGIYELVSEDAFFAAMRKILLERPAHAAERTGIEQLAYTRTNSL